ncbi:hypothetical protein [Streptomyces diacarni]|nr:hypothetical protein [Streptomyces diacarni]
MARRTHRAAVAAAHARTPVVRHPVAHVAAVRQAAVGAGPVVGR